MFLSSAQLLQSPVCRCNAPMTESSLTEQFALLLLSKPDTTSGGYCLVLVCFTSSAVEQMLRDEKNVFVAASVTGVRSLFLFFFCLFLFKFLPTKIYFTSETIGGDVSNVSV